jgi:hypothetical protein
LGVDFSDALLWPEKGFGRKTENIRSQYLRNDVISKLVTAIEESLGRNIPPVFTNIL